jgi:hypothetical protein
MQKRRFCWNELTSSALRNPLHSNMLNDCDDHHMSISNVPIFTPPGDTTGDTNYFGKPPEFCVAAANWPG